MDLTTLVTLSVQTNEIKRCISLTRSLSQIKNLVTSFFTTRFQVSISESRYNTNQIGNNTFSPRYCLLPEIRLLIRIKIDQSYLRAPDAI